MSLLPEQVCSPERCSHRAAILAGVAPSELPRSRRRRWVYKTINVSPTNQFEQYQCKLRVVSFKVNQYSPPSHQWFNAISDSPISHLAFPGRTARVLARTFGSIPRQILENIDHRLDRKGISWWSNLNRKDHNLFPILGRSHPSSLLSNGSERTRGSSGNLVYLSSILQRQKRILSLDKDLMQLSKKVATQNWLHRNFWAAICSVC